ncbi:unnamed protein product [Adineta ricciae]|uniref:Uncharacterized protein n=1 Tax=Adineta ricciae TaxID=249248 RepID=A0A814V5N1_ADIRI|nr:unnamed protein product [Adineta ricciae]
MANNRSFNYSIPADFSALLHSNFKQLNSLPYFDIHFLNEDKDWYLLSFLREQQRNGHSYEVTLAALNSLVGTLAENTYFRGPVNNNVGFLNQNHHIIGESASNKSAICQEISFALQTVNEMFPGRYSNSMEDLDSDHNTNKTKHKSIATGYSMVVSNATEVALLNNLTKVNTILLHSDGDVALNKLGYYDQGKNETSAGVSLFCDASDGLFKGFIRGTGVSQVKINRPVALLNMFVASTGTKMAHMLQRFHETKGQDGVFGRVFFTWCPSLVELPPSKTTSFTNIASFPHFPVSAATFFINAFELRHSTNKSDYVRKTSQGLQEEERLMQERVKQNVTTPATYSIDLDEDDIHLEETSDAFDKSNEISSFKLMQTLVNDWWKGSHFAEHHIKPIRRKVIYMLSKCIWSMKIIRILFRLMGDNLNTIDQKQGDRITSTSTPIDPRFQCSIEKSIDDYLKRNCQQKYIMWSNENDISVGYHLYLRKMSVVETLLTLKPLPDAIAERIGKKTTEKSPEEVKLDKAMCKVMNFSVVFFPRQYLTNNTKGEGSGQFSHSSDLKPDQVLTPLVESGLVIGGNFIKHARTRSDELKFPSFRKQLPSVIQNNSIIKRAFDDLGLNMATYQTTFEHQRLPLGMEFTEEAIEFMRNNDEFVQYYHNYYIEDRHFKTFREMVQQRIHHGEIIQKENKVYSNDPVLISSYRSELSRQSNTSQANVSFSVDTVTIEKSIETKSSNGNDEVLAIDSEAMEVNNQRDHAIFNKTIEVESSSTESMLTSAGNLLSEVRLLTAHVNSDCSFDNKIKDSVRTDDVEPDIIVATNSTITIVRESDVNLVDFEETENHALSRSFVGEIMLSQSIPLNDATNEMEPRYVDADESGSEKSKKRGRPISTNTTSQKWSSEEVNNMIIDPKSFVVWKSIIIKRQFILGTATDLFKMIPSRLFDETSRLKLIDFLLMKKLLVRGDWFCDSKGTSVAGYIKGSPPNPEVSMSLAEFGLDIEEYKFSLNPNGHGKRMIGGKLRNQSFSFSTSLNDRIRNDEWFKDNLEIDEKFMYVTTALSQTTSNLQVDQFQQQQKDKAYRALTAKRKKVDELQKETTQIYGTDIPAKRKRKPKIRED